MTDLKTLKDFRWSDIPRYIFIQRELKQEAIKWIKRNRIEDVKQARQTGSSIEKHIYFMGAEKFIKHFFNITEEDLK